MMHKQGHVSIAYYTQMMYTHLCNDAHVFNLNVGVYGNVHTPYCGYMLGQQSYGILVLIVVKV
jgi:hypothetical protein